jgi:hypothetical protein
VRGGVARGGVLEDLGLGGQVGLGRRTHCRYAREVSWYGSPRPPLLMVMDSGCGCHVAPRCRVHPLGSPTRSPKEAQDVNNQVNVNTKVNCVHPSSHEEPLSLGWVGGTFQVLPGVIYPAGPIGPPRSTGALLRGIMERSVPTGLTLRTPTMYRTTAGASDDSPTREASLWRQRTARRWLARAGIATPQRIIRPESKQSHLPDRVFGPCEPRGAATTG